MRNPKRIDRILKQIGILWKKIPDQRFMQIIANFKRTFKYPTDSFYVEDDKFEKDLIKFTKLNTKNS